MTNSGSEGPTNRLSKFKLVLLGESEAGKSSLVHRFVRGWFQPFQESTIGVSYLTLTVYLDDTTVE